MIDKNSEFRRIYRLIHETYVLVVGVDEAVTKDFDITPIQFRMLMLLEAEEGLRLTYLSDRVLRSKGQVTRIMDQLENKGLVRRAADPHDRRALNAVLTKAGIKLRNKIYAKHQEAIQTYLSALSKDERKALTRILEKLNPLILKFTQDEQAG